MLNNRALFLLKAIPVFNNREGKPRRQLDGFFLGGGGGIQL